MSSNAFAQCEREYNQQLEQREHAAFERMQESETITSLQRKDLDEAIDQIEVDIARARRYFERGNFKAAKTELDELLANLRAWDRGQYSPGNSFVEPSALIWPEKS